MNDFLVNVVRRGAGLLPVLSPKPSTAPDVSRVFGELLGGEADSPPPALVPPPAAPEPVSTPDIRHSAEAPAPAALIVPLVSAPAPSSVVTPEPLPDELEPPYAGITAALSDPGGGNRARAPLSDPGREPQHARETNRRPLEPARSGEAPRRPITGGETSEPAPPVPEPLQPASHGDTPFPLATPRMETPEIPPLRGGETAEVAPRNPGSWRPGGPPVRLGAAEETPAPATETQRIQIRIGRVEVRVAKPPSAAAPRPPERARGFGNYSLARRYLDRAWY